MSVLQAESAAIRVTWSESSHLYDLRWYGALDFIVPVWWLGIVDTKTWVLDRTDALHPVNEVPGELFRWLVPIVGQGVARQLVTLAASESAHNNSKAS